MIELISLILLVLTLAQAPMGCHASPYNDDRPPLNYDLLEKCIKRCKEEGFCCGNRLNGEALSSSWNKLSCANGCEIAYHSSKKSECTAACNTGNQNTCTYKHPGIKEPFQKCMECQEGCTASITEDQCSVGCDKAEEIKGFYMKSGECQDDHTWRFNNDTAMSCANWIGRNPGKLARKRCKMTDDGGKKVYRMCPVSCRCAVPPRKTCAHCGATCRNDKEFKYEGNENQTCNKWVRKDKANRCKIPEVREACPRVCNAVRKTGGVCTVNNESDGEQIEICMRVKRRVYKWQPMGCLKRASIGVGSVGYNPANMLSENGTYGWSYYRRAFDLIRDTPVEELGFGQWTRGFEENLEVCGRHPHSFVCEAEPITDERMKGELKHCGSQDLFELEKCTYDCCGKDNKCGLAGESNIEGGMGYWMYTLEHPHVKWMGPAAVNHWYRSISGTFITTAPNPCTKLGGAVRVSNQIIMPNDQIQFEVDAGTGSVNGFLGYMISRTPIGKRGPDDNANYWTVFLDAENYSGPIYYMSAWFWDSIASWSPKSVSWAHPSVLIDYAQQGFEGNIGGFTFVDEAGTKWVRTNNVGFPRDKVNGKRVDTSTLATGHSKYDTDWATDAMENMLSGTGTAESQTIKHVLGKSESLRVRPDCSTQNPSWGEGPWEIDISEDSTAPKIGGYGVGDLLPSNEGQEREDANDAYCMTRLRLEPNKLNCNTGTEFCHLMKYVRAYKDDPTGAKPLKPNKVPKIVKNILNFLDFEPTKQNDGRYLGPPASSEKACFEQPGPANPKLYCTRLDSGTWIAFKWYRFIDQPELNQVFASIQDTEERKNVRCYMQARIERLHQAVQDAKNGGDSVPRWFRPPQTEQKLPDKMVKLDPAYLVTPPKGYEVGFVPVPMWERNRERPDNCDVFLGDINVEPDPFPPNYYEGHVFEQGKYHNQVCPANLESNGETFTFPGKIFPYPHKNYDAPRQPYSVPVKEDVGAGLDSMPEQCGLPSDWDKNIIL